MMKQFHSTLDNQHRVSVLHNKTEKWTAKYEYMDDGGHAVTYEYETTPNKNYVKTVNKHGHITRVVGLEQNYEEAYDDKGMLIFRHDHLTGLKQYWIYDEFSREVEHFDTDGFYKTTTYDFLTYDEIDQLIKEKYNDL